MKFLSKIGVLIVLLLCEGTFSIGQTSCKTNTLKGLEEEITRVSFWDSVYQCAKNQQDFFSLGHSLNCIAAIVIDEGDTAKAFSCLYQAQHHFKKINNTKGLASVYLNLGYANDYIGRVSMAIKYYFQSLELSEKYKYKDKAVEALINLGNSYQNQLDYRKAEELMQSALNISKEISFVNGEAYATANLSSLYYQMSQFEKAISYGKKALEIRKKIGDVSGVAELYNNLSVIYRDIKDYSESNHFLEQAILIHQENNNLEGLAYTYINKSKNLMIQKKIGNALEFALKAHEYCNLLGKPSYIEGSAHLLHDIYFKLKKSEKAYEYYTLYLTMHDSILNTTHKKEFAKKEIEYIYEKRVIADSIKNAKKEALQNAVAKAQRAALKKERNIQWSIITMLFIIMVSGLIIYKRLRVNKKQSKIIELQKLEIDASYHLLDEKNREVLDSIRYAARIQRNIITSEKYIKRFLNKA